MTERGLCRPDFRIKLLLIAAALTAIVTHSALGQAAAVPQTGDAAAQLPAFEVASVKPNNSVGSHSDSGFDNGRFTAENISLKTLLQYDAYGIPGPQIIGGPDWINSERFDIEAKVDDTAAEQMKTLSYDQETLLRRQMVQELLADRFKLAVHWETKELPVYALAVAKGGPRLTASKDPNTGASTSSNNGRLTATDVTMEKLAQTLTQILARELGRVVIDKTGIEGRYDLTLTWSPENNSASMVNAPNEASALGPSIFTALREQLGLKLESTKGSVETLVIDHIEKPSEN
jgi:uncharacterized protein (TIGR03435 family)